MVSFVQTKSYPEEKCGICFEELENDVWSHHKHRFHGNCIKDWVNTKPSCPICMRVVDTASLLGNKVLSAKVECDDAFKDLDWVSHGVTVFYLTSMMYAASLPVYAIAQKSPLIRAITSVGFIILLEKSLTNS